MRIALLPLIALGLFAAACEASPEAAGPAPAPAPTATGPTEIAPADIHATFRFFTADATGASGAARTAVDKIVYTDRFFTRLEGLPPGREVTITARGYSPTRKGRGYTSSAAFVADATGAVDTGTMAPVRGTYDGVDADGLVWSMKEGALAEGLGPDRAALFLTATVDETTVGEAALGRLSTAENVDVVTVTDDGIVGAFYLPNGSADRVPVLAFGGSEGGLWGGESYAMRLASWGHPTLAVAYFGASGVPRELAEIPLEYFQKAFAWLDRRPEMRKGKVVVIGGSRGGELALQLGATFPSVAGVIAETPSSHRWAAVSTAKKAAWTFEGQPLAFVPDGSSSFPPLVEGPDGVSAYALRTTFEKSMQSAAAEALAAARVPVESTKGPILMLAGADDQMWPACDFTARALARLQETGHAAQYGDESVCFPETGHAVGSIGLPTTGSMWANIDGDVYALGGTARGNARAGRATDDKIRAFLARVTR